MKFTPSIVIDAPQYYVDRSDECKGKVNALKVKIAYLMEDIAFLEAKLIQSDIKRLEILGKDRNGNRYYWMDSNGSIIILLHLCYFIVSTNN